jgi:hypothetical protein
MCKGEPHAHIATAHTTHKAPPANNIAFSSEAFEFVISLTVQRPNHTHSHRRAERNRWLVCVCLLCYVLCVKFLSRCTLVKRGVGKIISI